MQKRIECKVTGRVQMVMYRDFAMRKAQSLSLLGSVQNMKDGSVFVVAEGEEKQLELFMEKLQKGSVLAHVENVECNWLELKMSIQILLLHINNHERE